MPLSNTDELLKLLDKPNPAVAVVPNAWDTYPPERKAVEVEKAVKLFEAAGFTTSLLDLTKANKESVEGTLKAQDVVWVMGGNTFYLNFYIHQSGFDDVVKDLVNQGLVYGGESAGAVIIGTTLHGIEHVDDPKDAPEVVWAGLSLQPYGIVPHWGWGKYQPVLEKAKETMKDFTKVVTLNNDQALVINDDQITTVKNPTT